MRDGRHPVLEAGMRAGEFVPNDLDAEPDTRQILLITGPNMAGKSTYLRQVALIAIMAQIGGFVPAAEATIGLIDRVLTRIGARDELRRGESTFMVEMSETARLLEGLSERSLLSTRRSRARHQHLRRACDRVGGRRIPARSDARQGAVRDALSRADRPRARASARQEPEHGGSRMGRRGDFPAPRHRAAVVAQLRYRGGAAGRIARFDHQRARAKFSPTSNKANSTKPGCRESLATAARKLPRHSSACSHQKRNASSMNFAHSTSSE